MITKKDVAFFGVTTLVVLGLLSVALGAWGKTLPEKTILPVGALSVALIALLFFKDKSFRVVLSLAAALLVVITVGTLISSHRETVEAERKVREAAAAVRITTTPPSPAPVTKGKPSEITKTSWGYIVNFTGAEFEGVPVFTAEKDADVLLRWIEGGKIHNPEDAEPHRTDPWGYTYYVDGWKERFKFSWCPGVKPHAVLALVKPWESLNDLRQEDILFFDKEKKEKKFKIHMNSGEELILYYHDVDDQYYFQRNGSDGSYMRFEIVIVL